MVALAADNAASPSPPHVALAPAYYAAALAGFLALYYVGHAAMYGALFSAPVI